MNVPLIGEQKAPPVINVEVAPQAGMVLLTITLLGCDRRTAPMTPDVAASVMMLIAKALEEVQPGTLIPNLEAWLRELKTVRANGQKMMRDLGISQ